MKKLKVYSVKVKYVYEGKISVRAENKTQAVRIAKTNLEPPEMIEVEPDMYSPREDHEGCEEGIELWHDYKQTHIR